MKAKKPKIKKISFRYLLFLPFLFLTFCSEDIGITAMGTTDVQTFTKDSKIVSLIMTAIQNIGTSAKSSNTDEQCVEFEYPMMFGMIHPDSHNIEVVEITSDEELFDFFDMLTSTDEIQLDFPMTLLGTDGERTLVDSPAELEAILQIAVDACSGSDDYEYCHDNNKKVYICHNGNTLCVSINAVQAHLDHGDALGQCDD